MTFILPDDVLGLIKEYSRPIGLRLDWRKGCYLKRQLILDLECELCVQKYYMYRIINLYSALHITMYDLINDITLIN
jgi:hypothetical protein